MERTIQEITEINYIEKAGKISVGIIKIKFRKDGIQ